MTDEIELTHSDRCDRCGSQAYIRIMLPSGKDLLMCGHHWTDHREVVVNLSDVRIQDELDKLTVSN